MSAWLGTRTWILVGIRRLRLGVSEDLAWLIDVLWRPSEKLSVSTDPGPPKSGYRTTDSFAVLPNASRPRFLVPLDSRRAASASLRLYNALRPPKRRLARAVIGMGLRAGIAQVLLRDRVRVSVAEDVSTGDLSDLLLGEHLRKLFGGQDVRTAIGIGGPGPYRKPVLQALTPDGDVLGYVKLGWNDVTRRLVRNEARALAAWMERPSDHLGVPQLIHHGPWRDLHVTIASPLPSAVRRYKSQAPPPLDVTRAVAKLHGTTASPLAESRYWNRLRERLSASLPTDPHEIGDTLSGLVEGLERRYGNERLTFGAWHGDLAPWNLAWVNHRLFVWDWEHSADEVPLGFDLLHFEFQMAFILKRTSLREAVSRCHRRGLPQLQDLGVPVAAEGLVLSLYLLEMFFRYDEAMRAGAGRNPRFYPDILTVLTADLERLG